jgi:hypothetical protein
MPLTGSCFCKATKFAVPVPPEKVTRCTCTFCTKRGALWVYYLPEEVEISVTGKATWEAAGGAKHNFCAACGCTTYSESPSWEAPEGADPTDYSSFKPNFDKIKISVNARLFDDFDLEAVEVEVVDGKNLW